MPSFHHVPVLLEPALRHLRPAPGDRFLDATLGGGGHAEALLRILGKGGCLLGCDRDPEAVEAARERLGRLGARIEIRQADFARAGEWIPKASLDGILLDLGVSSHQLDQAERGFSFSRDGPLDMRMDPGLERTAADLVNDLPAEELAGILYRYGGERRSRRLARAVAEHRSRQRIERTVELAELIQRALPGRGRIHPATRAFQALRMAVNREIESLEEGLAVLGGLLRPGGRMAVISFHSEECRRVKRYGDGEKGRGMEWVARKAVRAAPEEIRANSRSRSARLRVLERSR